MAALCFGKLWRCEGDLVGGGGSGGGDGGGGGGERGDDVWFVLLAASASDGRAEMCTQDLSEIPLPKGAELIFSKETPKSQMRSNVAAGLAMCSTCNWSGILKVLVLVAHIYAAQGEPYASCGCAESSTAIRSHWSAIFAYKCRFPSKNMASFCEDI